MFSRHGVTLSRIQLLFIIIQTVDSLADFRMGHDVTEQKNRLLVALGAN